MKPLKTLTTEQPVLHLKLLQNGLLCAVDAKTTIHFIDLSTYETVAGIKADVKHTRLNPYSVDIGPKGQVCITVLPESGHVGVFGIKKKRFLYKVARHRGSVESLLLDPKMNYMVTGGQDGKLFAWTLKSGKLADTLKPHTDYVTALAFHPDEPLVASGSFDRMIHIDTIGSDAKTLDLRAHASAVTALQFYGDTGLVSAGKNGELYLWERRYGSVLKRLTPMHDEISSIALSPDERILFVGTLLGFVAIYDLHEHTLLSDHYLKVKGKILSMVCISDELAVGTAAGAVHLFSLYGKSSELDRQIEKEQFKQFYIKVGQNPLLAYTHWYDDAERRWEEALAEAKEMTDRGEFLQAQRLLEPFSSVKGKGSVVKELLEERESYQQFRMHVEEGRYSLAYAMLLQYPSFRESFDYQKMERQWKQLFSKAQTLLEDRKGEEGARELLAPFRGISEKTALIQQLFQESKRFHFFKDLIVKREWKKLFELVKHYPFLKEFKEYAAVLDYADNIYINLQKAYRAGDVNKVRQLAKQLEDFPDYREDIKEILDEINP